MLRRLHRFDAVDSTNERAFADLAAGAAEHGDVYVARRQTRGRGTRGRAWVSPEGGLYLSVVLATEVLPGPGLWTMAGGLAVHDLARGAGVRAALDWPNDLVSAGGAKMAGVLAESRDLRPDRPPHVFVLGLGVNVMGSPGEVQGRPVSSLAQEGATLDLDGAEAALLLRLGERVTQAMEDPVGLHRAFFGVCLQAEREVEVEVGEHVVRGRWVGLEPRRGLALEMAGEGATGLRWISPAHVRALRASDAS